jgi:hypothetical protein
MPDISHDVYLRYYHRDETGGTGEHASRYACYKSNGLYLPSTGGIRLCELYLVTYFFPHFHSPIILSKPPCQISCFKVLTHCFVSMLNMLKHLFSGATSTIGLAACMTIQHSKAKPDLVDSTKSSIAFMAWPRVRLLRLGLLRVPKRPRTRPRWKIPV